MLMCVGCKEGKTPPPATTCAGLDTLFARLDGLEQALAGETHDWNAIAEKLPEIMSRLDSNVHHSSEECNYLDHRNRPERARFEFVGLLTEAAIQDTYPDILYYLVRLRSIFGEDSDINEYISEEMAHIAYANPAAYLMYMKSRPNLQNMLLNSTRWNPLSVPKLIQKFSVFEEGEKVVEFLEMRFNPS